MFKNFQEIPLCKNNGCSTNPPAVVGDELIVVHPNPFTASTNITFKSKGGHTLVQVIDTLGRVIRNLVDGDYAAGSYTIPFEGYGLPAGVYYARLQNGSIQQVKAMLKG